MDKSMEDLRKALFHEISGVYGQLQGQSISSIIIPAFMGDFQKVLQNSTSNEEVSEEYMTEDKKIHLILNGMKTLGAKGPRLVITGCSINGSDVMRNPDMPERIVI